MSVIINPNLKTFDYHASNSIEKFSPHPTTILRTVAINDYLISKWKSLKQENLNYQKSQEEILTLELSIKSKKQLYDRLTKAANISNRQNHVKTTTDMFSKHFLIGRGGFGHVYLATDKRDNHLYALKVVPKIKIIQNNLISSIHTEKNAFASLDSNFIPKLISTFQDKRNLYFQMEFIPGGDLRYIMKNFTFIEPQIRFIIGEIILALEEVHKKNIVHLDIKPSNVLFDAEGHIKLTDFGISVLLENRKENYYNMVNSILKEQLNHESKNNIRNTQRIKAFTLSYVAPEVLLFGQPSAKSDIWSLGVIMYELFYQAFPLNQDEIRNIIINGKNYQDYIKFPSTLEKNISCSAYQLMRQLLSPINIRPSLEKIKQSPFFDGFDFNNPRGNYSPLVPSIPKSSDPSKFNCEDIYSQDETPEIEYSEWAELAFLGFTVNKKLPGVETLSREMRSESLFNSNNVNSISTQSVETSPNITSDNSNPISPTDIDNGSFICP